MSDDNQAAFGLFGAGILIGACLMFVLMIGSVELVTESGIKTNRWSIHLDGFIYKIRIDTAATDSMHNAWKVGK